MDFKLYKSEEDWRDAGEKDKSYYPIKTEFTISCKKCGGKATLYEEYEFAFGIFHTIRCRKCGNQEKLYGVDG